MAAPDEGHENNMMEELPVDALTHCLLFMNISTRIKLASLNKTMQRRVYEECEQAWVSIDLSTFPFNNRLSDLDLSRLLEKVNAREVTKILNFQGCVKLRGNGLMPLRKSRVLERVDLRWSTADNSDPMPFLSVLRWSSPYHLTDVRLLVNSEGFKSVAFTEFLRFLRGAQSIRTQEQGTVCASCQQHVWERAKQTIPFRHGLPMSCCSGCKKMFCRRASCPVSVRECSFCLFTFCEDCNVVSQCDYCGKAFCNMMCELMYTCDKCKKMSCHTCGSIVACSCCMEYNTCQDCGIPSDAPSCEGKCFFCQSCSTSDSATTCAACNSPICSFCTWYQQCCGCKKKFCDKEGCRIKDCESIGCTMSYCGDCGDHRVACEHIKWCEDCGEMYAEACHCSGQKPAKRAKKSD